MMNVLFWNTGRKAPIEELTEACLEHDVDVLVLAEYPEPLTNLLLRLNRQAPRTYFEQPFNLSPKLKFVTCLPANAISSVYDGPDLSARTIRPPIGPEVLLFAAHLPSQLHRTANEQTIFAGRIRPQSESLKRKSGTIGLFLMATWTWTHMTTGWSQLMGCMPSWPGPLPSS